MEFIKEGKLKQKLKSLTLKKTHRFLDSSMRILKTLNTE